MADMLCIVLSATCRLYLDLSLGFLRHWAALAAAITHLLQLCRFRDNRSRWVTAQIRLSNLQYHTRFSVSCPLSCAVSRLERALGAGFAAVSMLNVRYLATAMQRAWHGYECALATYPVRVQGLTCSFLW